VVVVVLVVLVVAPDAGGGASGGATTVPDPPAGIPMSGVRFWSKGRMMVLLLGELTSAWM